MFIWGLKHQEEDFSFYGTISPADRRWWYFAVDTWSNQCRDCRAETYRLLSLQFAHSGVPHLAVNLVGLLFYGSYLEVFQGGLVTGVVFQLGVALATLGQNFYYAFGSLVGCSGGVYTLIGANVANAMLNGDFMRTHTRDLICGIIAVQLLLDGLLYVVYFNPSSGYAAHFTGFVVGALAVPAFGYAKIPSNYKLIARALCSVCLIILVVVMLNFYIKSWPPTRHYALPFHSDSRSNCCEDAMVLVTVQGMSVDDVLEGYYCDGNALVKRDE